MFLLWLTQATGICVTEPEVADVLYPSGAIKFEAYLRADITKGGLRNVYPTHARCLDALDRCSLTAPLGTFRY